jgi:hypothetical protein
LGGKGGAGKGGSGKGGTGAGSSGAPQGGAGDGSGGTNGGGTDNGGSTSAGSGAEGGSAGSDPTGGRGAAAGRAGNGGAGGRDDDECDELAAEYLETIRAAQECDPIIDALQCTASVPDSLGCGCQTFVNPKNEAAMARLEELRLAYQKDCPILACPAIACLVAPQGACVPDDQGSGYCSAAIPVQ